MENHILKYTKQSVCENCSSKNNDKIAMFKIKHSFYFTLLFPYKLMQNQEALLCDFNTEHNSICN